MISFAVGLIGAIVALVGWFGFHSLEALIIGTLFYVVESLIEWKKLNTNAKLLDLFVIIIGCVIALALKTPFYIGGMLAINIYSGITVILSLLLLQPRK